jgi:ubiquinol-cytochrome c reductase iron-sulfur subunit
LPKQARLLSLSRLALIGPAQPAISAVQTFSPRDGDSFEAARSSMASPPEAKRVSAGRGGAPTIGDENLASATTVEPTRRDFLFIATGAVAAVGAAAVVWPLINQMSPDASTLALASTEVDIGAIPEGQIITIKWRGKPVFISHRTEKEIKEAEDVNVATLPDPQTDAARVQKPQWLIVIGVCTHLGCIPLGHQGEYGGWFCPCHGSVYDTSGRIRKGPAPRNLAVPQYSFLTDTKVKIG